MIICQLSLCHIDLLSLYFVKCSSSFFLSINTPHPAKKLCSHCLVGKNTFIHFSSVLFSSLSALILPFCLKIIQLLPSVHLNEIWVSRVYSASACQSTERNICVTQLAFHPSSLPGLYTDHPSISTWQRTEGHQRFLSAYGQNEVTQGRQKFLLIYIGWVIL